MSKSSKLVTWGLSLIFLLLTTGLVYADSGLYVEASVGRTMLRDNLGTLPIDDEATAFRASLGFDLGNNIALEAGYLNLGEFSGTTIEGAIEGEVNGGTISAVFSLPVSDSLSLTARGGIFFWDAEVRARNFRFAEEGEDLFYGVGLRADLSDQMAITGEWDRIEFDDSSTDVLFAGISFKF